MTSWTACCVRWTVRHPPRRRMRSIIWATTNPSGLPISSPRSRRRWARRPKRSWSRSSPAMCLPPTPISRPARAIWALSPPPRSAWGFPNSLPGLKAIMDPPRPRETPAAPEKTHHPVERLWFWLFTAGIGFCLLSIWLFYERIAHFFPHHWRQYPLLGLRIGTAFVVAPVVAVLLILGIFRF